MSGAESAGLNESSHTSHSADRTARIISILILVALGGPAVGQIEPAVFVEAIDVGLTEIRVVVTDADGHPITGLAAEDFEIQVDRKTIDATHFAAFEGGRQIGISADRLASEDTAGGWRPNDRLNLVIYLDHAFLEPGELPDVKEALLEFLRTDHRPRDRVMLVVANHSLDIIQQPTTLPELVIRALSALPAPAPRSHAIAEFPRILHEIERVVQRGSDLPSLSREQQPAILKARIESFAAEIQRELELTTHPFHRLLPALAGLVGRTEVLYIGGTLPTNAASRLFSAWRAAFGPSSAYRQSRSSFGDEGFSQLDTSSSQAASSAANAGQLFASVTDLANFHGITVHTLDAGGLRRSSNFVSSRGTTMIERGSSDSLGQGVDIGRRIGDPQILRMMARGTGGRGLINSRSFQSALDQVARDRNTYYLLAFPPPDDGQLHKLHITLAERKRGVSVSHRAVVRGRNADRVAADIVVSALILGIADNPLSIDLAGEPLEPKIDSKAGALLPLYVIFPVDTLTLLAEGDSFRGQVSIYLTSGDLGAGAAEVQKTVVPLAFTAEQMAAARGKTLEYRFNLPVAVGSRTVAVTLRDDLRPLHSTAIMSLVPPLTGATP